MQNLSYRERLGPAGKWLDGGIEGGQRGGQNGEEESCPEEGIGCIVDEEVHAVCVCLCLCLSLRESKRVCGEKNQDCAGCGDDLLSLQSTRGLARMGCTLRYLLEH